MADEAKLIIMRKNRAVQRAPSEQRDNIFGGQILACYNNQKLKLKKYDLAYEMQGLFL
ncbi:MAG: hypothetical protein IKV25_01565 [Clostridia bacterium]|nr:hypothetical protein [Clostridia bacterium]